MKKFNSFENYLIKEGLRLLADQWKLEVTNAESLGRIPLMTTGYIDMVCADAIHHVENLTSKRKNG